MKFPPSFDGHLQPSLEVDYCCSCRGQCVAFSTHTNFGTDFLATIQKATHNENVGFGRTSLRSFHRRRGRSAFAVSPRRVEKISLEVLPTGFGILHVSYWYAVVVNNALNSVCTGYGPLPGGDLPLLW